jgi:hypothetical protein
VAYVGYENISRTIEVLDLADEMNMGAILLHPSTELLEGATITEERVAIRMNKDTVIYNADAFKTQPNDVVEDLLKKMPGIEVESDGTIKAEGEEVEKIYVDGKEFFGDDPKLATKNLPARAIKEVQVFDKKSDMAEFSGIDDGIRTKTINLKLKEDFKKGAFGTLTGGYGTEDRYNGKFNINSFSKKNQISTIGQLNNINEQGFSFNEYINFMGGMANVMRGGRVRINSSNSAIPIADGLSNGDTQTAGAGLNFNHEFNKKTKLNATYFFSDLNNVTTQNIYRNYFQNQGDFSTDEYNVTASDNQNHRVSARFEHEIDSTQSIRLSASLSANDQEYSSLVNSQTFSNNKFKQNESLVDNVARGTNQNINSELFYRKKFNKKGRSVSSQLSYSVGPSDQNANLRSSNSFFDTLTTLDNIYQDQIENANTRGLEFSTTWTEPIGRRKYLGLTYSYNLDQSDAKKDIYDLNSELMRTLNTDLSNEFDQRIQYQNAEVSFRWIQEKSNLNLGLGFQHSTLDGDIINRDIMIEEDYLHILPSLQWNYDFSRTKGVSVNYSTSINQPTLTQLQPIIDNTDPLNIYIGNPNLVPEYNHQIRLRFRNFSQFANTSLFGNINLTFTENNIVNSTTINERFIKTVTPVNIDNNFRGTAWASYGAPLRFIDSRINVNANVSYTDGATFINNIKNNTERLSNTFGLNLENKKKEILDWRFGIDYTRSRTTYSESEQSDQVFSNQTYWADVSSNIKSWVIRSKINVDVFDDNFNSNQEPLPIWEASISKYIFNNKGEIKLTAFDLLDKNQGYTQNVDLNYFEEVRSNTIGRYFMLSFIYNIGTFKQNAFQITGPRRRR